MGEALAVLMHDAVAGELVRLPGGRHRFTYDTAYRDDPAATPLSVSMPLEVAVHPDSAITPWLQGLLPEDDAVLTRWGRQFHVSASSPFALLGSPVGEDCAGAVRFCPEGDTDRLLERRGNVEWVDEAWIGSRLRELSRDSTAWLGVEFSGQFSLAGAQAKTALVHADDQWGVPHGAAATTHIIKPAIRGFEDHDINEHVSLAAGRILGLIVARTRVGTFDGERAIVIDRYDRVRGAEGVARIHQEDLCQALGIPPRRKYQNEGGPSARDVIGLLRRAVPARASAQAVRQFIDALIWNWVIGGTDAHAKNYSLLLSGRDIRVAPLYDIASALPYGVHERGLKMAMKIGPDYDMYTVRGRWRRAASEWDVDAGWLLARVGELVAGASDAFTQVAGRFENPLERVAADRLTDLVSARAARLAGLLG